ncbi:MAG: hypothetical protein IMX01_09160 [Limnochordaceae bacterium]|nr:hypothetical protein [Limnochordaceae bacterium]
MKVQVQVRVNTLRSLHSREVADPGFHPLENSQVQTQIDTRVRAQMKARVRS